MWYWITYTPGRKAGVGTMTVVLAAALAFGGYTSPTPRPAAARPFLRDRRGPAVAGQHGMRGVTDGQYIFARS
ncbi:hypothetical protein GXW82_13665 [Streptacidiphilus sp. 4-A2]|nr:hypothetical protein [Streptacidiphilus sp. 4-A2]